MSEIAVVFTARSIERILAEGGTSAWRLDPNRTCRCEFVVCTRNAHGRWDQGDWGVGPEPHHAAFVIGKIQKVVPSTAPPENGESAKSRYLIQFSEFARVNIPNVWKGDRNPVKYMSLENLDIDFSKLKWESLPEPTNALTLVTETTSVLSAPKATFGALTMAEAKKGLALTFNVPPEAIEITIRG
ncbi:hypothetical protein [Edaphobacter sp.]|uniref:hypothetical protein n=1 Tax=Edaphobacter sp. TaxID=1934404 RepID=UPI002DBB89B3|nr:hypothetical protein [Edaphobacter sp.]HEU5341667.1 hypothetical protein [Edaphobacter sp.]